MCVLSAVCEAYEGSVPKGTLFSETAILAFIPYKLAKYAELHEGTIANRSINSKKELVVQIVE